MGFEEPIWSTLNNKVSVVFNGLYYSTNQVEGVIKGVNLEGIINRIDGVTDGTKRELINILRLFSKDEGLTLKDIALKMGRPTKLLSVI